MAAMRFVLDIPQTWVKLLEAVAQAENVDKRTALIWIVQAGLQAKAREHGLLETAA